MCWRTAAAQPPIPQSPPALFRRALDVWRGAPLADLASEPFALGSIARLEEERLAVLEDRVEADRRPPIGARTRRSSAIARARCTTSVARTDVGAADGRALPGGHQADALAAYRQAREVLLEELGLEPSSDLRDPEQAILDQSPSLDVPAFTSMLPARGGNTTIIGEREHASTAALVVSDDRIDIGSRSDGVTTTMSCSPTGRSVESTQ